MSAKASYIGQTVMSVLVIMFGLGYGIRCLLSNQIFCAVCFGVMAYVCGYKLLLRASMAELRENNAKKRAK